MKSKHIGSSFDDFLKEESICEGASGHAIKRVIAWQLAEAIVAKKISKSDMARRLKTSRTQVARFPILKTAASSSTHCKGRLQLSASAWS